MVIGVTGKSGAGKSTYSRMLSERLCYQHICIDDLSHEVLDQADVIDFVRDNISSDMIKDGRINRVLLGDLIFTSRHEYQEFNVMLWERIKAVIDRELDLYNKLGIGVILDWILLPHTHYWKMCDSKVLIKSEESERKNKVMERDRITAEYLKKRDGAGISYD